MLEKPLRALFCAGKIFTFYGIYFFNFFLRHFSRWDWFFFKYNFFIYLIFDFFFLYILNFIFLYIHQFVTTSNLCYMNKLILLIPLSKTKSTTHLASNIQHPFPFQNHQKMKQENSFHFILIFKHPFNIESTLPLPLQN